MNIKRLFICAAALFSMMMLTGCDLFFDLMENPIYTKITMPTSDITLRGGQTALRQASTISPGAVTYTSSDESVASVDANGLVTALKEGTTIITAKVAAIDYWTEAQTSYRVIVLPDRQMENPLTVEATQNGTTIAVSNKSKINFEYSVNGGSRIAVSGTNANISLNKGEYVQFFSKESTTYKNGNSFNINPDKTAYVYGNAMSLVDDENNGFAADKVLAGEQAFCGLFEKAENITFHGTKRLELPATTLTNGCYNAMFNGCTSIKWIPEDFLPATSLAYSCYQAMFKGCTELTSVPENLLPATTLFSSCYFEMFCYCNQLKNAPVLPATELAHFSYVNMFSRCYKLEKVTCYAVSKTSARANSLNGWLEYAGINSKAAKTFVVNSSFTIDNPTTGMPTYAGSPTIWGTTRSYNTIPTGWTVTR